MQESSDDVGGRMQPHKGIWKPTFRQGEPRSQSLKGFGIALPMIESPPCKSPWPFRWHSLPLSSNAAGQRRRNPPGGSPFRADFVARLQPLTALLVARAFVSTKNSFPRMYP
jgi:hypothetical protein